MWKQTEWPNIRQNLLENTNNIIVVEDQVILIVDLDVVASESRNKHSVHYTNLRQTTCLPSSRCREWGYRFQRTCQDQQQSPKTHPRYVNRKPHTHYEWAQNLREEEYHPRTKHD